MRAGGVLVGGSRAAEAGGVLVADSGAVRAGDVLVADSGAAGSGVLPISGTVSVWTINGRKMANCSRAGSEATADERESGLSMSFSRDVGVSDKRGGTIAVLVMSGLIAGGNSVTVGISGDWLGRGVGHSANKLPVVGAGSVLLFWSLVHPDSRHSGSNRPIMLSNTLFQNSGCIHLSIPI